jgi:hypothetical protein
VAPVAERIHAYDWPAVSAELDGRGWARLPTLLTADECDALAGLYDRRARFRSVVDMGQHRFGRGEYRYFARPLPALVGRLRAGLYPRLSKWGSNGPVVGRALLGIEDRRGNGGNSGYRV